MLAEVIEHIYVVKLDVAVIVLVALWLFGRFVAWGANEEFRRGTRSGRG